MITRTPSAVMPIDFLAAERTNAAIVSLPGRGQSCRYWSKVDYPKIITYHLVGNPSNKAFRAACRKMGVRVFDYNRRVDEAIEMLAKSLDCNHKQAYKP